MELDAFVGIGPPTSTTNLFQKIFENLLTIGTTKRKEMITMEKFDLLNLPSCKGIEHHWSADKHAYRIAEYALCAGNSSAWNPQLLRRMNAVRKVIATEGQPFYAADVFGEIDGLGGLMNGLNIAHIIVATGNTRDCFIDFGDGYGRMVKAKEWKLAYPMADLWDAYNEVKQFIVDQL